MNETELIRRGYRITTRHLRYYTQITNRTRVRSGHLPAQPTKTSKLKPWPRGGITRVTIVYPDGENRVSAEAYCSPIDNYDRKEGHRIAYERAVVNLITDLHERTALNDLRREDAAAPSAQGHGAGDSLGRGGRHQEALRGLENRPRAGR